MTDLEIIRSMRPAYWARPGIMFATDDENGGGGDDDEQDDDDDEDEEDDDPDADKSDEELRNELKDIRKRLASSNDKGKRNRLKARQLQQQLDERGRDKGKRKDDEDHEDEKLDAAEIRRQALADSRNESDARIKRGAVRAELRAAGIASEQLARVAGMVSLDDLDVDDDGEVDGIDEAVEDLKREFPQLFGIENGKKRRPGVTGPSDDARGSSKRKLTVDQQLANQLLGKR